MDSDYKVETPIADSTSSTSASQTDKAKSTVEPPQQSNSSSTHSRPPKKKSQLKNKKKKAPYKPAYLDVIQQQIDDLKQEARRTYEIQARQNFEGELEEDEKVVAEKRMMTSSLIDQLEEIKTKLDTPDMLQRAGQDYAQYHQRISDHQSENNPKGSFAKDTTSFQQKTLTLLHFFYIVRLAQKGFFTLISQKYPKVEPNALTYLCDKLVGSSLFVVKDPKEQVRSTKRNQVFDLLQKLHDGALEPVGNGFTTTFKQVRHLIYDFIESTATHDDEKVSIEAFQNQSTTASSIQQQPPVWIVVPFNGMVDGLQQGTPSLSNSAQENELTNNTILEATLNKPANIADDNIPSATHERESTTQLNGSITPEVDTDKAPEQHGKTTLTTNDTTLEDHTDQEHKAILDNTLDANKPTAKTTTADAPSNKETLPNEPALHADTVEPTSTSISSTVGTDDIATETVSTDTTTITNNSSTTTNKDTNAEKEEEESSSGWGAPPSTLSPSSATASSAWTKGILPEKSEPEPEPETKPEQEQQQPQQSLVEAPGWTKDETEQDNGNSGWGSPMTNNVSPPAWEGKLPDDVVTPGDETISGDPSDSQWQPVSDYGQRRTMGSTRGRPSGYRGGSGSGFGQGRGGAGSGSFRSYGGDGRGGGSGGIRRAPGGSANAGWSKPRQPRPE